MTQQAFGDGRPAQLVELTNRHGMSIVLMDVGATWLSCRLPLAQESREVLLGVDTMADFEAQGAFMGASVGRYANRIANARYRYQGEEIQVVASQGDNCLHGGAPGWSHRRWTLDSQGDNFACFTIESQDGEQGFPGHVSASVRYELGDDNQVSITYQASTDKPTPVNLTNHAYFNLMGAESGCDVLGHRLSIAASEYLPIDDSAIPLGHLAPVQGSGFDFQQAKTLGQDLLKDEQQQASQGYDHSYWLNDACRGGQCAATLVSDDEQVVMQVFTAKPALQLYSGNWLQGTPGRNGSEYRSYQGVALETQFLPDSPNHPEWAQQSCILLPEQEYKFTTVYQFQLA
ncbi:galactose-1-epimerase [Vibrio sp. ABG19]|uniref:galactose-1-epimerase n=1 Tax=Vibrio sp. ABG19 TaxID=2817385 RepID=UPI00249DB5A4|nr:galactose-1-epimerase [Vibrio sp. ABG19]WGY48698.1 galactose-1-epimerase [Vibrio sp. ABG19]